MEGENHLKHAEPMVVEQNAPPVREVQLHKRLIPRPGSFSREIPPLFPCKGRVLMQEGRD
jgi:hypothetical protein